MGGHMLLPLSKTRLNAILDLYHPGMAIEEVGGYDTGVYFFFKGVIREGAIPEDRHCSGRIIRPGGFCSESLQITRRELSHRGGLDAFWGRVAARKATLQRWLDQKSTNSEHRKRNLKR